MELNRPVIFLFSFGPQEDEFSAGMESTPGALLLDKDMMTLVTSLGCGFASVLSPGTCGSHAMAFSLMADGRLSTSLKCSSQPSSIFLSEINALPSALRREDVRDEVGK